MANEAEMTQAEKDELDKLFGAGEPVENVDIPVEKPEITPEPPINEPEKTVIVAESTETVHKIDDLGWTQAQIDLIKQSCAKNTTNTQFALFLYTAKRMGVDPLTKQIYAVVRETKDGPQMTIQMGIDGLRSKAEETGCYCPGKEPEFKYDDKGHLFSATSTVKKLVGGTWHEVSATAHFTEYAQTRRDGSLMQQWQNMAHIMLAKCAEALALRRAFPMVFSGIVSDVEMQQADNEIRPRPQIPANLTPIQQSPAPAIQQPVPDVHSGLVTKPPDYPVSAAQQKAIFMSTLTHVQQIDNKLTGEDANGFIHFTFGVKSGKNIRSIDGKRYIEKYGYGKNHGEFITRFAEYKNTVASGK